MQTVQVQVTRGNGCTIPCEVFRHEIPVLQKIHMPENVKIVDENYGDLPAPESAAAEYDRMSARYNRVGMRYVEQVYRSVDELAKVAALKNGYSAGIEYSAERGGRRDKKQAKAA